jgi:choline-sulfatase
MKSRAPQGTHKSSPAARPARTRRSQVAVIIALLLVISSIATVWMRWHAAPDGRGVRLNVLLVTIDTLRWDHVGSYGARNVATPVLDRLATSGARFETAIMHVPLTAPSHATILTGVTPLAHGVRDDGAFVLPSQLASLAKTFRNAGYATAGFISGFPLDRRFGFARGFEVYDDRLPRGDSSNRRSQTERRADATTDRAIEWLDGISQPSTQTSTGTRAPWFAWVHYFDPHAAYDPPAEYLAKFATRPYDGEIAFVDAQLGRLVDRLQSRNQLGHTIVLVTADHGESLGEHGEDTHGVFVYDATLRVPFIVAGPSVRRGVISKVMARGVDVMPTLLDLAALSIPANLDGRSLRPALEGHSMSDEPAYLESLLAERHLGWAAVQGLRDSRWKYIRLPRTELYDLSTDVNETANRADDQRDRLPTFSRALDAQTTAPHSSMASAVPQPDRDTRQRLSALGYLGTAGPSTPTGRDPKDGIGLINRLERAIAQIAVDPGSSVRELRAVLAEDPAISLAARQLAVALSATGDHKGAAEEIRRLQARKAATAEDLLLLSESLRVLGDTDGAARAMEDAARLDPRSPELALTKARTLSADGDLNAAAAEYARALELSPDHPEALVGTGRIRLAQGDLAGAAADFERVLVRDPNDLDARTGLGVVRGRQGRADEVIALLEPVVREWPTNAEALSALGAAFARSGAPGRAIPYLERAVDAGMRTPPVLNGLGFARLEAGDRAGAIAALRASLSLKPDQPAIARVARELMAESAKLRDNR